MRRQEGADAIRKAKTPARSILGIVYELVYWVPVVILFIFATVSRFSLPPTPFSDPDTWGYLNPALSKLTKGLFIHTSGRSFPYPGFVYIALKLFGGFHGITILQHLTGIGAGAVMLLAWHRAQVLLPTKIQTSRFQKIVARVLGLAITATFLLSKSTVYQEIWIRPEALFPLFTVLAIYFAVEYGIAFYQMPNPRRAFWFGVALIYDSIFIYYLKPAWGFGVGFAMLPVLVSFFHIPQRAVNKAGILAVSIFLAAATLWYPERLLVKRYDPASNNFLAIHLFCFTANITRGELIAEIDGTRPAHYDKAVLKRVVELIDAEIDRKSTHYRSIGFDPDQLIYGNSVCVYMSRHFKDDVPGYKAFLLHYYGSAWLHQPRAMAWKVFNQWWQFYSMNDSPFDTRMGSRFSISRCAKDSLEAIPPSLYPHSCSLFYDNISECKSLVSSRQVWRQPRLISRFAAHADTDYPAILLFATLAGLWVVFRRFPKNGVIPVSVALWSLYFYSYNFGNTLTIAIVHSMEVIRYTKSQLIFTLFSEAFAVLLAAIILQNIVLAVHSKWWRGRQDYEEKAS